MSDIVTETGQDSRLPRRDPRLEWMARSRLHPEHLTALSRLSGTAGAVSEWMGPHGLIRRNPHAIGFVGPNGCKRIDRSGVQDGQGRAGGGQAGRTGAALDSRRRVEIEAPAFWVAVVPDTAGGRLTDHDRDLLGLARCVADRLSEAPGAVLAVVFDAQAGADDPLAGVGKDAGVDGAEAQPVGIDGLDEAGADRVIRLPVPAGYAPEARLAALLALEATLAPRHWLLPDAGIGGGDLGRRLAVRIGERPATGLWRIDTDDAAESGWMCLCRSGSGRQERRRPLPRVALALAECAEPVVATRHAAGSLSAQLAPQGAFPVARRGLEDLGAVAVDPAAIGLGEAEFILSAGNGVKDWPGFHRAAEALGATEGASRVAVDDGHMPRHRQVGATGTFVSARVYVAVGISGAIQHLQGIQRCDRVVAINADPGCDMVKRADLAVIADAGAVIAALVAAQVAVKKQGAGGGGELNGDVDGEAADQVEQGRQRPDALSKEARHVA